MKKNFYIFCHGFGFSKKFWCNLLQYFKPEDYLCWDMGYFGDRVLPGIPKGNYRYIGIGHSLGFIKLITSEIRFDKIIGLNSFINFLGHGSEQHHKRKREFDIFSSSFSRNPLGTLQNFYNKCGISGYREDFHLMNKNRLADDLAILSTKVYSKENLHIINSMDDIVVPINITMHNFSSIPNVFIDVLDKGMHALGYFHSKLIYSKIQDAL